MTHLKTPWSSVVHTFSSFPPWWRKQVLLSQHEGDVGTLVCTQKIGFFLVGGVQSRRKSILLAMRRQQRNSRTITTATTLKSSSFMRSSCHSGCAACSFPARASDAWPKPCAALVFVDRWWACWGGGRPPPARCCRGIIIQAAVATAALLNGNNSNNAGGYASGRIVAVSLPQQQQEADEDSKLQHNENATYYCHEQHGLQHAPFAVDNFMTL